MSLAQKIDNLPTSKLEIISLAEAAAPKVNTPIDFRQLVRRLPERPTQSALAALTADAAIAARLVPGQPTVMTPHPMAPAIPAEADVPRPANPAVALDLLTEVSTALSTLMDRCQHLESMLEATQDQAKTDLETANGEALKFLHRSEILTQMVAQLEETVTSLQQRVATAEEHVVTVSAVAEKKQHEAAAAECLSALFQQRVLTSFGEGSVGHSILESVRLRSTQMLNA